VARNPIFDLHARSRPALAPKCTNTLYTSSLRPSRPKRGPDKIACQGRVNKKFSIRSPAARNPMFDLRVPTPAPDLHSVIRDDRGGQALVVFLPGGAHPTRIGCRLEGAATKKLFWKGLIPRKPSEKLPRGRGKAATRKTASGKCSGKTTEHRWSRQPEHPRCGSRYAPGGPCESCKPCLSIQIVDIRLAQQEERIPAQVCSSTPMPKNRAGTPRPALEHPTSRSNGRGTS
jgi:hypothetical protein